VHYGKFSNWFLSGEYFFDVNPPFGKWVIALVANALGFDPSLDDFEKPGAAISSAAQVFAARAPAAFFGSLTVPVFYWLCRQLHLSEVSSFLGAAFILFDSMHVIQSRMIMVDSLLVFFTCVSLLCALLMWDAKKICILKGSRRTFADIVAVAALLVTTGVCCGFAVSVRWTAFATPAVVLVVSIFGIPPFCVSPLTWLEVAVLASSIFAAYYGSFAVFLMTASKSGTGNAFMSPEFQMCLQGSQVAMDAAAAGLSTECRMSMWAKFAELNKKVRELLWTRVMHSCISYLFVCNAAATDQFLTLCRPVVAYPRSLRTRKGFAAQTSGARRGFSGASTGAVRCTIESLAESGELTRHPRNWNPSYTR
jgi:dolichyl-phosphate-mannose--protein O-mannosyl transferase